MLSAVVSQSSDFAIIVWPKSRAWNAGRQEREKPSLAAMRSARPFHAAQQPKDEGVEKFKRPFDKLLETLAQRTFRRLTRES